MKKARKQQRQPRRSRNSARAENAATVFSPFNELYQIQVEFFFMSFRGGEYLLVYNNIFSYIDPEASGFIKLAFMNSHARNTKIGKQIT